MRNSTIRGEAGSSQMGRRGTSRPNARRANGLYDIAQIPATAMPLGEYDDRIDDAQEHQPC